jgi:hypothetical protein
MLNRLRIGSKYPALNCDKVYYKNSARIISIFPVLWTQGHYNRPAFAFRSNAAFRVKYNSGQRVLILNISPFKYEAQTTLFKDPVRTAQ